MEVAPSKKIIFQGDESNRFPNSGKVAFAVLSRHVAHIAHLLRG